MILHGYFRSGAAWRVRIGLHWKGVSYQDVALNLRTGEQTSAQWRARNPQAMVPALELDDGTLLTQSLAILEWLEETRPNPPFLPADPLARARIRAVALAIAADTHPVQNLRVLKRVEDLAGPDAARQWAQDTIATGLAAVEALIAPHAGPYAFGTQPTLADIVITPQLFNARRFGVDLAPFPLLLAAESACAELPAFQAARPEVQADAV
ncbi:maleylacetoacetate isomerase [Sandaracinobacter neustonicus]|uniref:Maleylacetoacetate isomerase n=1 Tax=Sandaracinobacter neustonicus TaxID=1715348 RepID=A0A501XJF8_9SPHN|nr:maleylacetoacetate isomerase [Sandaracinobacter neustonicus]TPE60433.1 maleylacetoacetate isomerase [Sandaracinobacter neustonicus]